MFKSVSVKVYLDLAKFTCLFSKHEDFCNFVSAAFEKHLTWTAVVTYYIDYVKQQTVFTDKQMINNEIQSISDILDCTWLGDSE